MAKSALQVQLARRAIQLDTIGNNIAILSKF